MTEIDKHNRQVFNDFIRHIQSQGVGKHRQTRYKTAWKRLQTEIDFKLDEASIKELKDLVGRINGNEIKKNSGGNYAEATKAEFRKFLNKLYTDYLEYEDSDLDWLKSSADTNKTSKIDPEQIPRPRHVQQMVEAASNPRDKTLFMVLWDTGARIGGLVETKYEDSNSECLKWSQVTFAENYVQLTIRDKSGERKIYVRECMPYLRRHWENSKAEINSRSEAVFKQLQPKRNGDRPLTADGVRRIIDRTREKTSIPDYISLNPHAWRKGRATYLASIGRNQAQLCEHFGWVQGSKEAAKYIRLAESDLKKALMQEHGLEPEEDEDETDLRPIKCSSCGLVNAATWDLCRECNKDLSGEMPQGMTEERSIQNMEQVEKLQEQLDEIKEDIK